MGLDKHFFSIFSAIIFCPGWTLVIWLLVLIFNISNFNRLQLRADTAALPHRTQSPERKLQGGSIFITGLDIPVSGHQIFFQLFGAWQLKTLCFFCLLPTWWLLKTLNNILLSGCFKILHFKLSPAVYMGLCISGAWPTFLQHFFIYHLLSGLDVSNLAFSSYLQY